MSTFRPRSLWPVLLLLGILLLGVSAAAEPLSLDVSPANSAINFSIGHLGGMSVVKGKFGDFCGKISFDPAQPALSSVLWKVQAVSVFTGNRSRDKDLRSEEYLDASHYPTLSFVSQSVSSLDASHLQVEGLLTIHGIIHSITFPALVLPGEFSCELHLRRTDYGMPRDIFLAGDEVQIHLNVRTQPQPQPAAPASPATKESI